MNGVRASQRLRLLSRAPVKRWDMLIPAQSQEQVQLNDVLLQLRRSLPGLRRKFPSLVRSVHRYYGTVRLKTPLNSDRKQLILAAAPGGTKAIAKILVYDIQ